MQSSLVNNQCSSSVLPSSCERFSLGEIESATNNFARKVHDFGLDAGDVYHGNISGKRYKGEVFVVRFNERFKELLNYFTAWDHVNIISLVGFCDENGVNIMVYEFVPNGSLYAYLHHKRTHRPPRLTVEQRLEICLGVAKGLCYLHSGTDSIVVHGNIDSSNILLDASLVPKISGITYVRPRATGPSLSQEIILAQGKKGYYTAPECYEPGHNVSRKADVYAFGVVFLEVLCEREPWNRLVVLALPFIMEKQLHEFAPEVVRKDITSACARQCEELIINCLEFQPDKRPSMDQVVQNLELALKLLKDKDINPQEQSTSVNNRSKIFSLHEIKEATREFSDELGQGGSGIVYRGKINNVDVAVKKMKDKSEQQNNTFETERKLLSACDHKNIISLEGYCDEKDEKIIVYEFMVSGSLHDQIHQHHDSTPRMSIEQRLEICLGVAEGLSYLHSRNDYNIIHSDLKTDNVLLDANFVPKISDFGLSRTRDVGKYASAQVTRKVHGTHGYIAPECHEADYKLSRKADVYAFGVVLLEVLCEKQAWEGLVIWSQSSLFRGELPDFVPQHVRKNISPQCSRACANLIRDCLDNDPNKRPFMRHVIDNLHLALTLQKMSSDSNGQANSIQVFSISDIKTITNEFANQNLLRREKFADVYLGKMHIDVSVKRIHIHMRSEQATQSFQMEVDLLSACHHANIISLLGYYNEPDEKILVFESMPNGSLNDYLSSKQDRSVNLTVKQRLEICLGVAKGLKYLHGDISFSIIHGDLKSNNILLDHNFVAKISHFERSTKCVTGLSNSQEGPHKSEGTEGYLAPECYEDNMKPITQKTDVYAFGVILLEVLLDEPAQDDILSRTLPSVHNRKLQTLMPEYVKRDISQECLGVCENLIRHCLERNSDKRPVMDQVVARLELALNVQNAKGKLLVSS